MGRFEYARVWHYVSNTWFSRGELRCSESQEVDGLKTEGFWRSHQVPFAEMATKPGHVKLLEKWMKSYRPEDLFDDNGALRPEIAALAPEGDRRMSANPHANGGILMREFELPSITNYAVKVDQPGKQNAEATAVMAEFLRDVLRESQTKRNFRLFGPDETVSNRLSHVFEVTDRAWDAETLSYDEHLAPRLTYRRTNHKNIHVRGYKEEGTTTTPFDMVVRNDLDRFHLASDVIDRLPQLGYLAAYAKQALRDKLIDHKTYIREHGEDMPEIKDWHWSPVD
jgi:phosphoketolase